MAWLKKAKLPHCPCQLGCVTHTHTTKGGQKVAEVTPLNPDSKVWGKPGVPAGGYHPGAKWCMRSIKNATSAGQQCCYTPDGKLITHGAGAGTVDKYSGTIRNFPWHREHDMLPWDWCEAAGMESVYWKYRPINKGPKNKPCQKNP